MPPSTSSFTSAALARLIIESSQFLEEEMRSAYIEALRQVSTSADILTILSDIQTGQIMGMSDSVQQVIENISIPPAELLRIQRRAVAQAGELTAEGVELGISFELTNPRVVQAARNIGSDMITNINKTVREQIREIIAGQVAGDLSFQEARRLIAERVGLLPRQTKALDRYTDMLIAQGQPKAEVRRMTKAYSERLLRDRASTISRTEVARATSVGQHEFWEQGIDSGNLPPNSQRQWIAGYDERVCDICAPMNGSVVNMDAPWMLPDGTPAFYPTDSHPNCRCTTGLVFPDAVGKADPVGLEWWQIIKGGPGSGENPGHPFRGNQYTGGIPGKGKGKTSAARPKEFSGTESLKQLKEMGLEGDKLQEALRSVREARESGRQEVGIAVSRRGGLSTLTVYDNDNIWGNEGEVEIEVPDFDVSADDAYVTWSAYEGNYQIRKLSASLMGLEVPKAEKGYHENALYRAEVFGVDRLDEADRAELADHYLYAKAMVNDISNADVTSRPLYRGLGDVPANSPVRNLQPGDEFSAPVSAWSDGRGLAEQFSGSGSGAVVLVMDGPKRAWKPEEYYGGTAIGEGEPRGEEVLSQGDFKVTGTKNLPDGTLQVTVEQTHTYWADGLRNRVTKGSKKRTVPEWVMEFLAGSVRQPVTKGGPGSGAQPGHKFRGNQHTGGIPENAPTKSMQEQWDEATEEWKRDVIALLAESSFDFADLSPVFAGQRAPLTVALSDAIYVDSDDLGIDFFNEQELAAAEEKLAAVKKIRAGILDSLSLSGFPKALLEQQEVGWKTGTRESWQIDRDLTRSLRDEENYLVVVEQDLAAKVEGSKLLAKNVDLDLLVQPPEGKMNGWADSVAANPDGGAGFIRAIKRLANPDGGREGLVTAAAGELITAHMRRGIDPAGAVRLSQDVSRLDFTKPEALQVESSIPYEEFNDPILNLLPPESLRGIDKVMKAIYFPPTEDQSWKDALWSEAIAPAFKHSVNGRIAERIYATSGDRTIVGNGLADVYAEVDSQTREWAGSAASNGSAQLQKSVSELIGNEESFDEFALRQNHVGLRSSAFTDAYAQAVYAETQALLAMTPELGFRAARGTRVDIISLTKGAVRSPSGERSGMGIPLKVAEKIASTHNMPAGEAMASSTWQVSTETIGRQPLSSWSTSTKVANQFASLSEDLDKPMLSPGVALVQRALIPESQVFATALTGPGCLAEQEVLVMEGTPGKTSVSMIAGFGSSKPALTPGRKLPYQRLVDEALKSLVDDAAAIDADGDGWILEGTDQARFVGKADFVYDREVPVEIRSDGLAALLTWIPENWDAAYKTDVTKGGPGSGARPGHKFRGNQHTGGIPENAPSIPVLERKRFETVYDGERYASGFRQVLSDGYTKTKVNISDGQLNHKITVYGIHPVHGREWDLGHVSWKPDGQIEGIYVEPAVQRRGLGTQLHRAIREIADDFDLEPIRHSDVLTSSGQALKDSLYKKGVAKGGPGSGSQPGHKFRGNQWTGGIPENLDRGRVSSGIPRFEDTLLARPLSMEEAAARYGGTLGEVYQYIYDNYGVVMSDKLVGRAAVDAKFYAQEQQERLGSAYGNAQGLEIALAALGPETRKIALEGIKMGGFSLVNPLKIDEVGGLARSSWLGSYSSRQGRINQNIVGQRRGAWKLGQAAWWEKVRSEYLERDRVDSLRMAEEKLTLLDLELREVKERFKQKHGVDYDDVDVRRQQVDPRDGLLIQVRSASGAVAIQQGVVDARKKAFRLFPDPSVTVDDELYPPPFSTGTAYQQALGVQWGVEDRFNPFESPDSTPEQYAIASAMATMVHEMGHRVHHVTSVRNEIERARQTDHADEFPFDGPRFEREMEAEGRSQLERDNIQFYRFEEAAKDIGYDGAGYNTVGTQLAVKAWEKWQPEVTSWTRYGQYGDRKYSTESRFEDWAENFAGYILLGADNMDWFAVPRWAKPKPGMAQRLLDPDLKTITSFDEWLDEELVIIEKFFEDDTIHTYPHDLSVESIWMALTVGAIKVTPEDEKRARKAYRKRKKLAASVDQDD